MNEEAFKAALAASHGAPRLKFGVHAVWEEEGGRLKRQVALQTYASPSRELAEVMLERDVYGLRQKLKELGHEPSEVALARFDLRQFE